MFGANRTGDAATTLQKSIRLVSSSHGRGRVALSILPIVYPIFVGFVKGSFWICPDDIYSIAHFCADVKGGRGDSGEIQGNFAGI
jgi:hypothetical protein